MKKKVLIFLGSFLFVLFSLTAVVYAFSGNHVFYSVTALTNDGHSYKGEYQAVGTFPIYGLSTDNSKVSLKGILRVTEEDGAVVNKENCMTVKAHAGEYLVTVYSDTTCDVKNSVGSFRLVYHLSNEMKQFSLKVLDPTGVEWTLGGYHEYTPNK